MKKGALKKFTGNSQNSQENTCARVSFFNKVTGVRPATLLKKRLWHRRFSVNFVKFLRTNFFTEHLWTASSIHTSSHLFQHMQQAFAFSIHK